MRRVTISTPNRERGPETQAAVLQPLRKELSPAVLKTGARNQFPILEEQLPLACQIPSDWTVERVLEIMAEAAAFSLWKEYQPCGAAGDNEKPKVMLIVDTLDDGSLPTVDFRISFAGITYLGRLFTPQAIERLGHERAGLPDGVIIKDAFGCRMDDLALGLEDFFYNGQLTGLGRGLVDYLESKIQDETLGPLFD